MLKFFSRRIGRDVKDCGLNNTITKARKHLGLTVLMVFLILFGNGYIQAAPGIASVSGNWSNTATWGGSAIPTNATAVTINQGVTVTVDIGTAQCLSLILNNNVAGTGVLQFNSGTQLTVSGTVTMSGNAAGKNGTLIMTAGGTLICNGFILGAGTNTWTPGTGTVQLNAGNTLPATIFLTFNNLIVNTGTTTMGVGLTINGDLTIASGAVFSTSGSNFAISTAGNWTNNGGTFTPGANTVTFTGNSSAINGTSVAQTFNNIIVNKTAGQTLSLGGSTATLTVNGNFTETTGNFTAPATMTITGAATLTAGTYTAGTNTSVTGNWTNNGGTFTPNGGTVTFTGAASAINGTAVAQTFNDIVVNKTAGLALTVGGSTTTLNVNNYTETTGNFTSPATMTMNANATLTAGTFTSGANISVAGN